MPNLPAETQNTQQKVAKFFNEYYSAPLEFPSNEVDAVIGFFENRGFEKTSAATIGSVLMRQAKIDEVKIFELLDTLKGFDEVQLSKVVTEVLNYNRQKMSSLGYKIDQSDSKLESRNILV
jgi:hypothetical protein|tara:strand:+ start:1578 stop:1940 length:363 start_codon:yes stop_codon:yes gene_type:complete